MGYDLASIFLFNFQQGNLQMCVFILLYLSVFPMMIFLNKFDLRARIVKLLNASYKFALLKHCSFAYDCLWKVTDHKWLFPHFLPACSSMLFP